MTKRRSMMRRDSTMTTRRKTMRRRDWTVTRRRTRTKKRMSRRSGRTTSRSALPWRRRKQRARHAGWPPPPLRQQQRVAGRDRAGFSGARRRWEPAPWPRTRGRCGGVGSGRRDGGSRGTCKATAVARGGASSQGEAANNPSRR
jgi:hypothetical protein